MQGCPQVYYNDTYKFIVADKFTIELKLGSITFLRNLEVLKPHQDDSLIKMIDLVRNLKNIILYLIYSEP